MSNPFNDDVWLEFYNSRRELDYEPEQVFVPAQIDPPQTLADYEALSKLTVCAYEHAHGVGIWHEARRQAKPITSGDVATMARDIYAVRVMSTRLSKAEIRGDFNLFDGTAHSAVSIQVQMIDAIRRQGSLLHLLAYKIVFEDPEGFSRLPADRFVSHLERAGNGFWCDPDRWSKYTIARAELSKVQVHLQRVQTVMTRHDDPEKNRYRFRRIPTS